MRPSIIIHCVKELMIKRQNIWDEIRFFHKIRDDDVDSAFAAFLRLEPIRDGAAHRRSQLSLHRRPIAFCNARDHLPQARWRNVVHFRCQDTLSHLSRKNSETFLINAHFAKSLI